jgi:sulfate permease, SulP family
MGAMPEPPSPRPGPLGAVQSWLGSLRPEKGTLRADMLAGLPGAIGSVPDGMAASVLVGVSPIYGLYASALGPVGGGLFASTRLMVITTTSAAALAAGSALSGVKAANRPEALFLLTVIGGAVMVAAGLLHFGRYTRFVSHSVMIGFLSGIGVNIILGQVPDLLGVPARGSFAAEKAVNALAHPDQVEVASLLVGLSALGIIVALSRTPLRSVGAVVALVVPSVVVVVAGLDGVARVSSAGAIPQGVPLPHLPKLSELSFSLVTGALAVAAIVLVQGAGVAESALNPDGSLSDANRDFIAQGVGNLASGFFRGQPVGGSVGQTALNVAAGAKGRWAAIWSGLWMVAVLAAFSGAVGKVAIPTLAAVLMYAAFGSLRFGQLATILRTGRISQVAVITTFAATLFLPVATAVGIGVALSLLLQLNREALDLAVVEVVRRPDGRFEERPAPAQVRSESVIVLDVHGSLFYAGARTLQARLPDPIGATHPVVVLRLRGRTSLGATAFHVLADYADRLGAAGGRLYLSGLGPGLIEALERTGQAKATGPLKAFEATPVLGESSADALADANAWLISKKGGTGHER